MKRTRAYVYTLNNPTEADEAAVVSVPSVYHVYGRETAPTTGTPHLQGFIYFAAGKTPSAVSRLLPRCHIEVARDIQAAILYCKKDGDFWESGTPPMSQKRKGEVEQERYEEAWQLAKKGRFEEIPADIRLRHISALLRVHALFQEVPASQEVLDFHWWYGPSGSGKSRHARQENPEAYLKLPNKWWDGYQGQDCVIIDEWSPSHSVLADHLKRWADHHPFAAEVKGGTICIRPPRIIITSNYTMDECFPDQENEPLKRRFKIKEFPL